MGTTGYGSDGVAANRYGIPDYTGVVDTGYSNISTIRDLYLNMSVGSGQDSNISVSMHYANRYINEQIQGLSGVDSETLREVEQNFATWHYRSTIVEVFGSMGGTQPAEIFYRRGKELLDIAIARASAGMQDGGGCWGREIVRGR